MADPMRFFDPPHSKRTSLVLTALMLPSVLCSSWACEGESSPVEPSTTSIEVTTSTQAEALPLDPYTVMINRSPSGKINPNGTFTLSFVPRGSYLLGLDGLPEECRSVSNPRQITVDPDQIAYVTFLVLCRVEGKE